MPCYCYLIFFVVVIPTLNLTSPKISEDLPNILKKRKGQEVSTTNKENKENLGKSDANGVNNGFLISYLGLL